MKNLLLFFFILIFSVQGHAFSVIRTVDHANIKAGGSVKVTVTVGREGETGPGKLVEKIPAGFDAVINNKAGGKVSLAKEGQVIIKWLGIPMNEQFSIEYTLKHLGGKALPSLIEGSFSYMKEGAMKKVSIERTSITVGGTKSTAIAAAVKSNKTETKTVKTTNTIAVKKQQSASIKKDTVKTILKQDNVIAVSKKNNVSSHDAPLYRVQIGAFKNRIEVSDFKTVNGVYYKKIGQYYKYFTGAYSNESDARKCVADVKSKGILDAFIVKDTQN